MRPASPEAAVLAFDVGGTDTKAGILQGPIGPGPVSIRDLRRVPTPRDAGRPGDAVVERLAELAKEYSRVHPEVQIAAVGLTVPGLVDEVAGTGIFSANLGWENYPFAQRLSGRLGLPVAFGHDVGMAGEAEFRIGAARGRSDVIVLVIGTGIAGAVFTDGRRVAGGGFAGELGHALVPAPDGSLQVLEAVGSAGAVARRFQEASGTAADDGARGVLRLARLGDEAAQRIWADAVDALAFTISQCVSILGTGTVVLGGGLAEAGDALFAPVARRVDELLTFHRRPSIVRAELGQNAGLIGSALKARALLAGVGQA
jgi:glucokinase